MGLLFANNAASSLASAITSTATTVGIQTADAVLFPAFTAADDHYMLVIEDRNHSPVLREIVRVTASTGASLTVIRGQEGTTALGWAAGVSVSNRLTAGALATLVGGLNVTTQLYLGAYSSAPTKTLENRSLVAGNLYYDTVLLGLQQYSGTAWAPITAAASSLAFGTYLGSFATPPITMSNGTALVTGTLYYDTTGGGLQVWTGGAWVASTGTASTTTSSTTTANVIDGNVTITGDVTAAGTGHFANVIADNDVSTATLHIAGQLVVTAGDVSGTGTSQNFPSGSQMQWGTHNTTSGGYGTTRVDFPTPFTSPPFVIVSGWANNVGSSVQLYASPDASGFSAGNTLNTAGSVPFSWLAIGTIA